MTLFRTAAAIVILASTLGFKPALAAETTFTDAQKEEIIKVLEQHLKDKPEIIVSALELNRENEEKAEQRRSAQSIEDNLANITSSNAPSAGSKDADITVIEFFDYNCGYCKRAVPEIQSILKDDPNVRFIFKEMPILGPTSKVAARYALAAHKQDKYFDYHLAIMEHRGPKDEASLEKLGKDLGLDVEKLKKDAASKEIEKEIERVMSLSRDIGIRGTPAFIIGSELFRGYLGPEGLKQEIAKARAKKKK